MSRLIPGESESSLQQDFQSSYVIISNYDRHRKTDLSSTFPKKINIKIIKSIKNAIKWVFH